MNKIINCWSIGWNTQGRSSDAGNVEILDLSVLCHRCKVNKINPCIVRLGPNGVPYLISGHHIDLINIYGKVMIKDGIFHHYRTNKLTDVAKGLLGYGKYRDYTGDQFKDLPSDEKEKYVIMDSQLVMDLSKYNNYEALQALYGMADVLKLDFEYVCKTNLTTWWADVFDRKVPKHLRPVKGRFEGTYEDADVLTPKKGIYNDIVVVDGKSLYPSVAINYNISFDTISSCKPCKDKPEARICNIFPAEFTKDFNFVKPKEDWICVCKDEEGKRKLGFFPTYLEDFKAERLKEKELGNKSNQYALKVLIKGGYGAFGAHRFRYYDPRVAELITAAGRYILSEMQSVAKNEYGFEIIYGDTDSLFCANTTDKALKEFQERFNAKYDIELEIKNKYDLLLLSVGKKHYVGYEKGEIDVVGYEGEKSDRCALQQQVFSELLDDIIKKQIDPLLKIRKAFEDLDSNQVNPDLLKLVQRVNQPPNEYDEDSRIGKIAIEYGVKQGELTWFYDADTDKVGKSYTQNPSDIDIVHYKGLLFNVVAEILDIAGYDLDKLAQEFGVKINKDKRYKKKTAKKKESAKKSKEIQKKKKSVSVSSKKHSTDNSIDDDNTNTGGGR